MENLKEYLSYLKEELLESLVDESLSISKASENWISKNFNSLPVEEFKESSRSNLIDFIDQVISGQYIEYPAQLFENWKKSNAKIISDNEINAFDIVAIFNARKSILLKFLPDYTSDVSIALNIMNDFDILQFVAQKAAIEELLKGQKENEKIIKDSESKFRQLLESAPDSMIMVDRNGTIVLMNLQTIKLFNYSREELTGKNIMQIIPERVHHVHQKHVENYFLNPKVREMGTGLDLFGKRKDDTEFPVEISLSPISIDNINYTIATIRDITEKKKNETKFRQLLESAPDSMIIVDVKGTIVLMNLQTIKLFNYSREELTGKNIMQIIPDRIHNVHQKHVENYFVNPKVREMGSGLDLFGKRKDNSEFPVEISLSPISIDNSNYTIAIIRDISEKKKSAELIKQSQEWFSTIFHSSPVANYLSNIVDGKLIQVNNAFLNLIEYTQEEVLGKSNTELELVPVGDRDKNVQKILDNKNQAIDDMELRLKTKTGKFKDTVVYAKRVELQGTPYFLGSILDVTELKKKESKIIEINSELESFAYSVSHDLRAPLRAIHGYTQIFMEDYFEKLDDEGKRLLDVIQSNAKKMGNLIDDLLAFSRIGRKSIRKIDVNLNELVSISLDELTKTNEYNAELKIDDLANVKADPALIKQVVLNLISNALKYSKKSDCPIIHISTNTTESEIIFSVKDNGVGFDMQYYDKLFGVFQRLHSENEFEGTGVGLAIVKRIINKHDGKVWAQGEVEKGSTFYFSLPMY